MRNIKYIIGAALASVALVLSVAAMPRAASAEDTKVTICHATNAQTNPYTINTVSKSSVDEPKNQYLNGHGDHTGDVWYPSIPDHSWGDIIPPFDYVKNNQTTIHYNGYNFNSEGEAIWKNNCNIPIIEEKSVIVFDVACDYSDANKTVVTVTFKNVGGLDGSATLNGEEVPVASGATVVKHVDLGTNVKIVIDENTVYDKTLACEEEKPTTPTTPGQVLGAATVTQVTAPPVGGVSAGAGGGSTTNVTTTVGLLGSIVTLGLGLLLRRKWSA